MSEAENLSLDIKVKKCHIFTFESSSSAISSFHTFPHPLMKQFLTDSMWGNRSWSVTEISSSFMFRYWSTECSVPQMLQFIHYQRIDWNFGYRQWMTWWLEWNDSIYDTSRNSHHQSCLSTWKGTLIREERWRITTDTESTQSRNSPLWTTHHHNLIIRVRVTEHVSDGIEPYFTRDEWYSQMHCCR